MIVVVSPAKSLDFEQAPPTAEFSQPDFLDESSKLVRRMRKMDAGDLSDLMGIKEKLATLNVERFRDWRRPFTPKNAKPALFAFQGDVYKGLEAEGLTSTQLEWTQQHLRILSGLYGALRPLDLIQPYRLEMGLPVDIGKDPNLYSFWGTKITESLNAVLAEEGSKTLVNLASNEYFKSVRPERLEARVVTPVFKDDKNGKQRVISFYAKWARGAMVRHLSRKRAKTARALRSFTEGGYAFDEAQSTPESPVFVRHHD
ncbi:MAG: peroxide stress protein YaaA [Acidobacteriota bacterium]